MNVVASSSRSVSQEEKMGLLEDKSPSETESERSSFDLKRRYQLPELAPLAMAPLGFLRSVHWKALAVRFAIFLIPSFLQGRHAREQIRPAKLSPTAYLDGMRGLAALFVFFCHFSYQAFEIADSWGAGGGNYYILKLPFIRLFYQGPAAVCVFFVISGYALSYRPTKLVRNGAYADLSTTMSSLIFRRAIRLYLPTAISTLFVLFMMQTGVYELTRDFAITKDNHHNVMEPHPLPLDTWSEQLHDWCKTMFQFLNVWNWDGDIRPSYDVHLWTIPIEYRCSLFLFLVVIGTARLRTHMRFLTVGGLLWFTLQWSKWEFALFLCGMMLAEYDHIRGAHVPTPIIPVEEKQPAPGRHSSLKSIGWTTLSIVSLYLLSQPDGRGEETPGWIWLTSLIPDWWDAEPFRVWQSIGAVLFIFTVGHSPMWQRFFNTAVVQYFGKISYAIYLMHGPAMHAIGYHYEKWIYSMTGLEGDWYTAGFFMGSLLCVPTVVWWADVFWRAIDIPCVKFAKWFENKCIKKD